MTKTKRIVKVHGDRGVGSFEVELVKRYKGPDIEDDEVVYQARVTKEDPKSYSEIETDTIVYVVGYQNVSGKPTEKGEYFGEIDPFIYGE